MSGLKSLFLGLTVILLISSVGFADNTVEIVGDPFSKVVRSFIYSIESMGRSFDYKIVNGLGEGIGFDAEKYYIRFGEKEGISLRFSIKELFVEYLNENKDQVNNQFYIIYDERLWDEEMMDILKKRGVNYSFAATQKDIENLLNKERQKIGKKKVVFIVMGDEDKVFRNMITPLMMRNKIDNARLDLLLDHLCGRVMDQELLSGIRNVEFYSFVSCLDEDEMLRKVAENVEKDYYSAIIGLESYLIIKNEIEGVKNFTGFIMLKDGRYKPYIKRYVVLSDGVLRKFHGK
ncbi:MAG: hypothetical protein K6348_09660 [Deferribacterales bacterium]